MRRTSLAVALIAAAALAACGRSPQPSTAGGIAKGRPGQYFYVNLFTPPLGGIVTSDVGGASCGASAVAVDATVTPPRYVYTYYGTGADKTDRCGQIQIPWASSVTLTAAGQGGNAFLGWAGDCAGLGPCTLGPGADKTVVALFGPPGSGHPDFTDPATHGPAYFAFLAGGSPLRCTACHGPSLEGQGIAPACATCHAAAGWADWRSNCSFCHGARTPAAQAGYRLADHPAWAAPPDALSQRLTGLAAPDRTGAHQAHLLGATPGGLSVAPAFACATCHPVPSDLSHVGGAAHRAEVVLGGAGQASLPASLGSYDAGTGTCATYCHGAAASPAWSSTGLACGGCHAAPPPDPHPYAGGDLTACAACHAESMGPGGAITPGGRHLDGVIQATGGHPDFSLPSVHGPAFLDRLGAQPGALGCAGCHGATYDGGLGPSCTACHAARGWTGWQTNCSFCHGATSAGARAGYAVASQPTWSAPPDAVSQRLTGAAAPARTGAHLTHLTGTTAGGQALSTPFACQTCHAVPSDVSHVGGAGARATVTLAGAGQAALPAALGSYAQATGTCATYCHGATLQGGTRTAVVWTDTGLACNACHFVASPPAPHPAVDGAGTAITTAAQCRGCHPDTVKADGTIDAARGYHVNGEVDGGGHADFTSPATHGPAFFGFLRGAGLDCTACHGQDLGGGLGGAAPSCTACHAAAGWTGWQTNCSFCHGLRNATTRAGYALASHPTWSAPPDALSQRLTGTAAPARTGAHQVHLTGSAVAGPFTCNTCHAVPTTMAHAGGPGRAAVVLTGAGQASLPFDLGAYSQATGSCTTYCHAATPVGWAGGPLGCDGCHAAPPGSGEHDLHVFGLGRSCSECHAATVTAPKAGAPHGAIVGRHVNGLTEVQFSEPGTTWTGASCTSACHPDPGETFTW